MLINMLKYLPKGGEIMRSLALFNTILNRLPILGIIHVDSLNKGVVCPKIDSLLIKESESPLPYV